MGISEKIHFKKTNITDKRDIINLEKFFNEDEDNMCIIHFLSYKWKYKNKINIDDLNNFYKKHVTNTVRTIEHGENILYHICIMNDCKYMYKTINIENYSTFLNEIEMTYHLQDSGVTPHIYAAWICYENEKLLGNIIMEYLPGKTYEDYSDKYDNKLDAITDDLLLYDRLLQTYDYLIEEYLIDPIDSNNGGNQLITDTAIYPIDFEYFKHIKKSEIKDKKMLYKKRFYNMFKDAHRFIKTDKITFEKFYHCYETIIC